MIIANPLFDTVFKGFISDKDIAKELISTLICKEVIDITTEITEYIKPPSDDQKVPSSIRLDYKVTTLDEQGTRQQFLIEIQKTSGSDNIMRFREYVAIGGYKPKANNEIPLPLITVYILGFKLENIPTPCLKVERQYVDMLDSRILKTREDFVELLTHDAFIIQAPRIITSDFPKTNLERLLSLFEQKNFVDDNKTMNYKYTPTDPIHKKMVEVLHYYGTDPEERKKIENEAYWMRFEESNTGALMKALKKIERKDKEIESKVKEIESKVKEIESKDKKLMEIAQKMKEMGLSLEEISKLTGIQY
jgi:hypothetical protein